MNFFLYTGAFFIAVFILILVHEFGHFLAASFFKVKVERFSIGFGKPLYRWKKKPDGTEYVLAPIIIGGYVKLLDSRETKVSPIDFPFTFDHKPVLQRVAIIAAGPIANIIFSFFAFWLMFVIGFKLPKPIIGEVTPHSIAGNAGVKPNQEIIKVDKRNTENWSEVIIAMLTRIGDKGDLKLVTLSDVEPNPKTYRLNLMQWQIDSYSPDPLQDFGIIRYRPFVSPIVHKVASGSPAEKFGIKKGDRILRIEDSKISDWADFMDQIKLYPNKKITLIIKRDKNIIELQVTTTAKFSGLKKIGYLGVSPDIDGVVWPKKMLRIYEYNAWSALGMASYQMWLFIELNGIILGKLILGKISLSILGGPIATFAASGQALESGFVIFLGFLAMISLAIAIVNLLPLPGLDGGFFVVSLLEAIRRRPISQRTQILIFRLGLAIFVLLILQTTANDLVRIFGQ